MNTARIIQLLTIGQLAADLHNLKNEARHTKDAYLDKLEESGEDFSGLDPCNTEYAGVVKFTQDEYKAHLAAKRRVYNLQRRLDNACRKLAEVAA